MSTSVIITNYETAGWRYRTPEEELAWLTAHQDDEDD